MNRKVTITVITSIIIGGVLLAWFSLKPSTDKMASADRGYTPKELWEIQYNKKKERRKNGYSKLDKPDKFTEYYKMITTPIGAKKNEYSMGYKIQELKKAQNYAKSKGINRTKSTLNFVSRGPGNVGGRTRAIVVDTDDTTYKTWFVGAATGGIWKTTDEGKTWTNLSDKFTNLSVNALAMAASNHDVIYAGTGESFPGGTYLFGNGVWKSVDRGNNWTQLSSTATDEKFGYINRIIIDPTNPDIVLVATEKGIFKSVDGGNTWSEKYKSEKGVEDLVENPTDFNILFAGENSKGVLRSADAGETWSMSSNKLGIGSRFEIAVSKVNPDYVFVSKNISKDNSEVFLSKNSGQDWVKFDTKKNLLDTQGDYDNIIEADPYDENKAYVGGVNLWRINFNGEEKEKDPSITSVYTENADFLSFVNFTEMKFPSVNGGMDTTDHVDRVASDWVSVEIRFGAGLKQKAHRFTVPNKSTSGVPADNYTYADYIEVPFQVWDVTNNRQLMVSFRDQEKDGKFNLYKSKGTKKDYGDLGREYIFVNAVPYDDANPSPKITKAGMHLYKCLYMFWPILNEETTWTWDADNVPNSKIVVKYESQIVQSGEQFCIGDAYGRNEGDNQYKQGEGFGKTKIPGLHPDHHNLVIIPTGAGKFTMINTNDGGIAISKDQGKTFEMILNNYVTTQFYGVAKHPEKNTYIGGMQDNGTWKSATGKEANDSSKYYFMLGGDGFECLWHAENPNLILGSLYNNSIFKTSTGGTIWKKSVTGIKDGDGPFITRLSASAENPDLVFAVGSEGVYRSNNFGTNWKKVTISDKWLYGNQVTSSHNVEVSLANGKIVWAGGGLAGDALKMQVSTDEGKTFKSVARYDKVDMMAYLSGISTHPLDEKTAYFLFSVKGKPKVLRTTDLGETLKDISGFETNSVSSNGFPDVVVHCLLVMPYNPNIIWVGTDIGMFESTDNGTSWHLLDANLPQVSIYDMQMVGNQIIIATHGRGIWSVDIKEMDKIPFISTVEKDKPNDKIKLKTKLKVDYDSLHVVMNENIVLTQTSTTIGDTDIDVDIKKSQDYRIYLNGYLSGKKYRSNVKNISFILNAVKEDVTDNISVYPSPNDGVFTVKTDEDNSTIEVYAINGVKVYSKRVGQAGNHKIEITNAQRGTYFVKIIKKESIVTKKIIVQ